ncbi:hypothetical protein A2U01_0099016, partial [Trifolium medium]|nr:hypothetical protein [Trifolium medium]
INCPLPPPILSPVHPPPPATSSPPPPPPPPHPRPQELLSRSGYEIEVTVIS